MILIPADVKESVHQRVKTLCTTAGECLQHKIDQPSIGYRRSGGIAGSAYLQRNHVNFNPLYLIENHHEYIQQVIPHEVAHLVVYQCFGKVKPHGKEWQSVMREVFNRPPLVRHSMTSPALEQRQFAYQCACGSTQLTIRRHNKVVRGEQQYQCRRCKQILTPI